MLKAKFISVVPMKKLYIEDVLEVTFMTVNIVFRFLCIVFVCLLPLVFMVSL